MPILRILLTLLIPLMAFSPPAHAASQPTTVDLEHVSVTLLGAVDDIAPGRPFYVAAHITLKDHWHTYAKDPGDAGIPTTIIWTLPEGFKAGEIAWPPHKTFDEAGLTTYGYDEEVMLPVLITPPAEMSGSITLTARVDMLVCKDICVPQSATISLALPSGSGAPSSHAADIEQWVKAAGAASPSIVSAEKMGGEAGAADIALPVILLFAVLGGLILNLMPCVFPVLSLKALAIARYSTSERRHLKLEAYAYTAGILTCFLFLAGLLIFLQQAGLAIGWGYQFQSSGFVGLMALLFFAIGLNLSGMFELPVLFGQATGNIESPHSLKGGYLTGLLAALVATPCTAPFMATAIGFSLSQPPAIALLVFACLGIGLALPFLLISLFPALLRFMPKPGAWMETFRQFLAFPMYASAIWLLWVVGTQAGPNGMLAVLLAALATFFMVWAKRPCKFESVFCKTASWLIVLAMLAVMVEGLERLENMAHQREEQAERITPYSAESLAAFVADGTPVFINATASWCITCQANYRLAISNESVQQLFADNRIIYMEADWTRRDPEVTNYLASFGYNGVPLYVYYAPGKPPVVLPQILTPTLLIDTLGG